VTPIILVVVPVSIYVHRYMHTRPLISFLTLDYLLSSRSTMAERTFYIMICMSCVTSSTPVFSMRRQSILMPCCYFSSVPFIRAKSRSSVGVFGTESNGESLARQSQSILQRNGSSASMIRPKIERPDIIYSNNHLLVVNKPCGWKSQPGDGGGGGEIKMEAGSDPKCLLTYLKSQSLGGGSNNDFLMPTHRLDQPCTGILIFAKNGKAASRVQVAWSKKKVSKCYWVVVEGGCDELRGGKLSGLELLQSRSVQLSDAKTYRLSAVLQSSGGKNGSKRGDRSKNAGGSVTAKPCPGHEMTTNIVDGGRVCHIEWKHLFTLSKTTTTSTTSNTRHLLSVTTDTGAKHQVRALLGLAGGTPISGDLRYGNNHNSQYYSNNSGYTKGRVDQPLPDGSVALHARSVFLPTVSLGGMEFLQNEPFVASIPTTWREFFGISEEELKQF